MPTSSKLCGGENPQATRRGIVRGWEPTGMFGDSAARTTCSWDDGDSAGWVVTELSVVHVIQGKGIWAG